MENQVYIHKLKQKEKMLMKRSSSTTTTSVSCFTEDEILVAQILLDLPNLIPQRITSHRLMSNWGLKKKRSVPSIPEESGRLKVKVESTSPSTPLCFYPSESDDKSKINLKKRTKEELVEIIDELTRTRESIRMEVENERSRFKKLKSLNLVFKEKKQQGVEKVELKKKPQLLNNNEMMMMMINNRSHYHDLNLNLKSNVVEDERKGPIGIPDLNVGLEEGMMMMDCFQPLDRVVYMNDRLMCATQARRRRMIKIKEIKKRHLHPRVR